MAEPHSAAAIDSAALCDVGRARSINQDCCDDFTDAAGCRLFMVADGMGGHSGGEVASRLAVDVVGEVFQRASDAPDALLRRAFEAANERIFKRAAQDGALRGMGTTGVALLLGAGEAAWVANAGDSRAYRVRAGRIEALTADHSYVAELERRGVITPEEAATHPRRNEILRSLGGEAAIEVDVSRVDVEPGDRFVLCSDGLWGLVSDAEIAARAGYQSPDEAARSLVDLANARGGLDNISVQIVAVRRPVSAATGERVAPAEPAARGTPPRARGLRRLVGVSLVIAAALAGAILWLVLGGPAAELGWPALWERVTDLVRPG